MGFNHKCGCEDATDLRDALREFRDAHRVAVASYGQEGEVFFEMYERARIALAEPANTAFRDEDVKGKAT